MKVYDLSYPNQLTIHENQQYSLAIGFFDGLHKGHQAVIQTAIHFAKKKNLTPAVMTFNPHPSHVLGGGKNKVGYISPYEEKLAVLKQFGIEAVFIVKFDEQLASLTPEQFVHLFIKNLSVKHVVAGFDYTFGVKGAGTMQKMADLSNGEYETTIVGKVTDDNDKVSSTRIRQLLAEGNVEKAYELIGRPFKTVGTVVHGEKKGRKIGFPTANVMPPKHSILPGNGVYAVRFSYDGKKYNGVCNVGVKPTFNTIYDQATIEVHIFHFDQEIYGKDVEIEWLHFIRHEQKFESVDALVNQIKKDRSTAESLFNKNHE